jgi:hypothetical protein
MDKNLTFRIFAQIKLRKVLFNFRISFNGHMYYLDYLFDVFAMDIGFALLEISILQS